MKAAQIIGSHDPDELHAGTGGQEEAHRVIGVADADGGLDPADINAWMPGEGARGRDPILERGEPPCVLERVARRHQPPDPVEAEAPQRNQARGAMRLVQGIERAAEQADAQPAGGRRQGGAAMEHQSRHANAVTA